MADPISIAASIAGIISLADVVFIRLVKYTKAVKDAADEVKALAAEVNSLGGSLHSLSRVAQALNDEPFDATLRMHHIEGCHFVLSKIEKHLLKAETDLAKPNQFDILQRKLKWPLTSARVVKELQQEISRHKESIMLAVSADSMNALLRCLAAGAVLQESATEILMEVKETRRITTRIQEDSERRKVLDFFIRVNAQDYYETSLSLRHPRTGLWLFQLPEFQTWMKMPGSRLWLSGIPGAGKTVLAGSIIESALSHSSDRVSVAFYFCDYRDDKTKQAVNILGALATQLALQNDHAFALLERCYRDLNPSRGLPKKPTVGVLVELLTDIIGVYDHTYIVVDGLDECGKQVDEVIEALAPPGGLGETLSIALLSRDESNIRDQLSFEFKNIEISAHSQDIAEYVSAQIEERLRTRRLRISDITLKGEIRQSLIDGAGGMFRWVACQLDHLGECYSDRACREALRRLPPDLPETYARILQRVPESQVSAVQMILNFTAFAEPKLNIAELQQALSTPNSGRLDLSDVIHEHAISKPCSSLIRKSQDGLIFLFAHFSVQEFLESDYLGKFDLDHFKVSKERCYQLLAKQSLRFLLLDNFKVRPPPKAQDHIELIKRRHSDFPMFQYASLGWFRYARSEWADKELMELAIRLFDKRKTPNFTYFAMELSPITRDSKFGGWLEKSVATEEQLVEVVEDMLQRTFQPLHLAAILALPEICEHLVSQGCKINLMSSLGTPLECAVAGLRLYDFDQFVDDEYRWSYLPMRGDNPQLTCVPETVKCLLAARAEPGPAENSTESKSSLHRQKAYLFPSAFRTAHLIKDWSTISILLAGMLTLGEDEVTLWGRSLDALDEWAVENRDQAEQAFKPFLKSLNLLIDLSPTVLQLCSVAWKKALYWGLPFAMDPMAVNSRISLADDAMGDWAFSAVGAADMDSLEQYLQDPRADPGKLREPDGDLDSLLHIALRGYYLDIDVLDRLEVFKRLLEASCSPTALNVDGGTPLHVWQWEYQADGSGSSAPEEVVRAVLDIGFDITIQDKSGRTILHSNLDRPLQLKAILEQFAESEVDKALRLTNILGDTPLMEALERGREDAVTLLLAHGHHCEETWKGRTPILALVASIGSVSILQSFTALGLSVDNAAEISPLHHISHKVSLRCVQMLESMAPGSRGKRLHGRLPIERYLESCLKAQAAPVPEAAKELATPQGDPEADSQKVAVWEYFSSTLIQGQIRIGIKPGPEADRIAKSVRLAMLMLIEQGYLAAYEASSNVSALKPVIAPFGSNFKTAWPLSPKVLSTLVEKTEKWEVIIDDADLSFFLLLLAFHSMDIKLLRALLNKGLSLQARRKDVTALEQMCRYEGADKDQAIRRAFDLVFGHIGDYPLNDLNPKSNHRGLLHQAATSNSPWLVKELIGLGADPNIRAGPSLAEDPALVYHILRGSFQSARALLSNGADPTLRNDDGFDAALAASSMKFDSLFDYLIGAEDHEWKIDWSRTCTFVTDLHGEGEFNIHGVNGYHIAALIGNTRGLDFFHKHELIPDGPHSRTLPEQLTPLHLAAMHNKAGAVEYLIHKGADVNARCSEQRTPLHYAVRWDAISAVETLLQQGAKIVTDKVGETPLTLAYHRGKKTMQVLLREALEAEGTEKISAAAPVKLQRRQQQQQQQLAFEQHSRILKSAAKALAMAVQSGDLNVCKTLYAQGCPLDVDLPCGGCSPLFLTVDYKQTKILRWLLRSGASTTKSSCTQHGRGSLLQYVLSKRGWDEPRIIRHIVKCFVAQGGNLFHMGLVNAAILGRNTRCLRALLECMEEALEGSSDSHRRPVVEQARATPAADAIPTSNRRLRFAVPDTESGESSSSDTDLTYSSSESSDSGSDTETVLRHRVVIRDSGKDKTARKAKGNAGNEIKGKAAGSQRMSPPDDDLAGRRSMAARELKDGQENNGADGDEKVIKIGENKEHDDTNAANNTKTRNDIKTMEYDDDTKSGKDHKIPSDRPVIVRRRTHARPRAPLADNDGKTIWTAIDEQRKYVGEDPFPLEVAVRRGEVRAARLLIEHGAGRHMRGHDDRVQRLLSSALGSKAVRSPGDRARLVRMVLDELGAPPDSREYRGVTALMQACDAQTGRMAAVEILLEKGADPNATSVLEGLNALGYAARGAGGGGPGRDGPALFARLALAGADPHHRDAVGASAVHYAMHQGEFTSLLVNGDFALERTAPFPWRMDDPVPTWYMALFDRSFRLYKRRLARADLVRIANLEPGPPPPLSSDGGGGGGDARAYATATAAWSPLCIAVVLSLKTAVANLVELGADLDHEGCPDGSALMAACRAGRMACVKVLVRRGARVAYVNRDDVVRSAIAAAAWSRRIVDWLLVGRYTEQKKITAEGEEGEGEAAGQGARRVRPWSGPAKAELVLMDNYEREPSESSEDYYIRLQDIKVFMRGKVVPQYGKMKTCRPSRLVPVEIVRRHPEDERAPREDAGEQPAVGLVDAMGDVAAGPSQPDAEGTRRPE